MRQTAIYGKESTGMPTTTRNVTAASSKSGRRILPVWCESIATGKTLTGKTGAIPKRNGHMGATRGRILFRGSRAQNTTYGEDALPERIPVRN